MRPIGMRQDSEHRAGSDGVNKKEIVMDTSRRVFLSLLVCSLCVDVLASGDSAVAYLLNEPVTMMDLGLLKLERVLIAEVALPGHKIGTTFNAEQGRILITVTDSDFTKAPFRSETEAKQFCRTATADVRRRLGITLYKALENASILDAATSKILLDCINCILFSPDEYLVPICEDLLTGILLGLHINDYERIADSLEWGQFAYRKNSSGSACLDLSCLQERWGAETNWFIFIDNYRTLSHDKNKTHSLSDSIWPLS